jgi:hypothetical protein
VYEIFRNHNPEYASEVRMYAETKEKNKIILQFRDGRSGSFKIEPGHYILEIKEKKI